MPTLLPELPLQQVAESVLLFVTLLQTAVAPFHSAVMCALSTQLIQSQLSEHLRPEQLHLVGNLI